MAKLDSKTIYSIKRCGAKRSRVLDSNCGPGFTRDVPVPGVQLLRWLLYALRKFRFLRMPLT